MKTRTFRIPVRDYEEIAKLARHLEISIQSAYSIWKKKNKIGNDFLWQEM